MEFSIREWSRAVDSFPEADLRCRFLVLTASPGFAWPYTGWERFLVQVGPTLNQPL